MTDSSLIPHPSSLLLEYKLRGQKFLNAAMINRITGRRSKKNTRELMKAHMATYFQGNMLVVTIAEFERWAELHYTESPAAIARRILAPSGRGRSRTARAHP